MTAFGRSRRLSGAILAATAIGLCCAETAAARTRQSAGSVVNRPAKGVASEPSTQVLQQIYDFSCRSGQARCASDGVVRSVFVDDLRKGYLDVRATDANRKRVQEGAIKDVIDFDVFADAKEYRISDFKLAPVPSGKSDSADRSLARAEFKNNGTRLQIEFEFVRLGEVWKINDIHWRHRNASLRALITTLQGK